MSSAEYTYAALCCTVLHRAAPCCAVFRCNTKTVRVSGVLTHMGELLHLYPLTFNIAHEFINVIKLR